MSQTLVRFIIGGAIVSAFAIIGDVLKPKRFAGLFGAAPSVALATLALTVMSDGTSYAATEGRSMMACAIAFFVYASLVSHIMIDTSSGPSWSRGAWCLSGSVWRGIYYCMWAKITDANQSRLFNP